MMKSFMVVFLCTIFVVAYYHCGARYDYNEDVEYMLLEMG